MLAQKKACHTHTVPKEHPISGHKHGRLVRNASMASMERREDFSHSLIFLFCGFFLACTSLLLNIYQNNRISNINSRTGNIHGLLHISFLFVSYMLLAAHAY